MIQLYANNFLMSWTLTIYGAGTREGRCLGVEIILVEVGGKDQAYYLGERSTKHEKHVR